MSGPEPSPKDRSSEAIRHAERLQSEAAAKILLAKEVLARAKMVIDHAREIRRHLKDPRSH